MAYRVGDLREFLASVDDDVPVMVALSNDPENLAAEDIDAVLVLQNPENEQLVVVAVPVLQEPS